MNDKVTIFFLFFFCDYFFCGIKKNTSFLFFCLDKEIQWGPILVWTPLYRQNQLKHSYKYFLIKRFLTDILCSKEKIVSNIIFNWHEGDRIVIFG